uniref:hypothetical protein n=1 Tax=Klebsiella pneumoniae TaxID=573 RepID=UPI0025A245AC
RACSFGRWVARPQKSPAMTSLALYAKRYGPGATGVQSMILWGGCAAVTALWLVQPFDWIKKQLEGEKEK